MGSPSWISTVTLGSLLHIPMHPDVTTRMSWRSASAISSIRAFITSRAPAAIPQVPMCTVIFTFASPSRRDVLLAVCSFIFGYGLIDDKTLAIPISFIAILMLGLGVVLFNKKVYQFCCKIFNVFPKLKKGLMNLHDDISLLKENKKEGYKAILISCLSQVTFVTTFYFLAKSLDQNIPIVYFC